MPISRMFNADHDAIDAVDDLKRAGYRGRDIHLFTKAAESVSPRSIVETGIPKARAHEYAERVNQGGALVIVDAPFGGGAVATEILERPRVGDSGVRKAEYERLADDSATPFSSALQIRVLSKDPAPFSAFWRMPTLSRRQSPTHSWFGWALLSRNAAPLSSLIGKSVLSDNPAPLSSRLGRKLLTDDPTPLSSRLGIPVLTKGRSIRDKERRP